MSEAIKINIKHAFVDWSYSGNQFDVSGPADEQGVAEHIAFPSEKPGGVRVIEHV